MTESIVLSVVKDAIQTAILVSAPILLVATVVGLIISIFQATTQIRCKVESVDGEIEVIFKSQKLEK